MHEGKKCPLRGASDGHSVRTMPAARTFPLYDRVLGGRLELILRRYRNQGLSYEAIARALAVDHDINVVGATVRRWLNELDRTGAA